MPVFVSSLVRATTGRHVLSHATLLVQALLCESLYFDELFTRPRADPRVLLVVRWLRHQPSRAARGPLAASPASTLTPPRAARGVVAFFGAVLCDVALEASCCCPHGTPWVTCLLRRLVCSHSRRHPALVRSRWVFSTIWRNV